MVAYQYMLDSEITILQMKNGELFLYYQHIMVQSISYMLVVYIHGYGFTTAGGNHAKTGMDLMIL